MMCLSIAGSIVAGTHYYAVDLPQQQNVQMPENNLKSDCLDSCTSVLSTCLSGCQDDICRYRCEVADSGCRNACSDTYAQACITCTGACDIDYYSCLNRPGYTEGDCDGIRDSCTMMCPC